MQTVIFKMYNERGHLLPSFSLAKKLTSTGNFKVVYIAGEQFRDEIIQQGFIFERDPEFNNIDSQFLQSTGYVPKSIVNRYLHRRPGGRDKAEELFVDYASDIIEKYRPVVIFIDELHINYVIAFHDSEIPLVTLSTYMDSTESTDVPPPNSNTVPDGSIFNRMKIRWQWQYYYLCRLIQQIHFYLAFPGGDFYYRRFCRLKKFDFQKRVVQKKYYWIDDGTLDKLVLSSPCIDFPRHTRANIFHVGLMIDLNRTESTINWDIYGEKPIVYCSLGTQVHKDTDRAVTFFGKLISVFSSRSDVSLIVSVSAELRQRLACGQNKNVYLVEDAPQLEMLKRCEFMITHGGMGSIKECIRFAVPMLVFPLNAKVDQAGNAARAYYHKIGLRGDMNQSAYTMGTLVDTMLTDLSFKRNVVRMQHEILDEEKQELFTRYLMRRLPSLASSLQAGNADPASSSILAELHEY